MNAAAPKQTRERRHACGLYVRRVKGDRYQLRWWLAEPDASINCGLYASEWLAERVRDEVIRETRHHPATALGLWRATVAVLGRLRDRGYEELPDPLPKYVRRRLGGSYSARVRLRGLVIECPGPYADPESAHAAMLERLAAAGIRPGRSDRHRRPA